MEDRVYVSLLRIKTHLFKNVSKRKVREVLVT